jgi:hypothetical protein
MWQHWTAQTSVMPVALYAFGRTSFHVLTPFGVSIPIAQDYVG